MQRQHAVGRNGTNTVREGKIVGELRTNVFLTGNYAGLDHTAFTQTLEELFAQHRVGDSAVNQDRAGTVEGLFGAVNLQGFVCLCSLNTLVLVLRLGAVGNVGGGNGMRLGEGHLQQVFDEGIKPAQLGVGECARCFFAVAGDKRYGVVGVE